MAAFAGILFCVVSACTDEMIYQNDFSTRTSEAAIRSIEWKAVDYVTGYLANTNYANPLDSNVQRMQDGWIKGQETSNIGNARVYADSGNNMATLGDTRAGAAKDCIVKQRLGSTFTNGMVTVQFDFLVPTYWAQNAQVLRRAVLSVGDERFYSPNVAKDKVYRYTVGGVGVALNDGRKVYWNADVDTANTAPSSQVVARYAWHRAIMMIDLDARTWGFAMYQMGEHPVLDAATPATPVHSESNLPFADSTVTSVSSICLNGFHVSWAETAYSDSTTPSPTHIAAFDNIRVSHNGVECYVNDFAVSRRHRLDGTMVGTYTPDCLVTNRVEAEVYKRSTYLLPDRKNQGETVQPTRIDGWRRTANKNGTANAHVIESGDYVYLRVEQDSSASLFGFFAHPFGSTVRSGKVRISVDAQLPDNWKSGSVVWVTLGDDQYYNAPPADANNYRFAAVGIRGTSNNPTYVTPSGVQNPSPTAAISATHWYRLVVTADLDAGTSEYRLYEQGTSFPTSSTADGTLIYTSPAIGRLKDITSISCFSLGAYYASVKFDNVRVWRVDGTDETLLYENYFSSRTIYSQDMRVAPLVGTLQQNPEGQDGWTRLDVQTGAIVVSGGANPSLEFGRGTAFNDFAVHDLGQTLRSGVAVVQADIRPPKSWLGSSGSVYVRLGGDAHLMGNLKDNDANYLKNIAVGFGFKQSGDGMSGNLYTNSTIVAYRGDCAGGGAMEPAASGYAVDSTHWYRFVARSEIGNSQYDLAVYDMGEEQPTLATKAPAAPIATFTALPFRRAISDLGGVSCISVSSTYNPNSAYDDALTSRIDNLCVKELLGLIIIVE